MEDVDRRLAFGLKSRLSVFDEGFAQEVKMEMMTKLTSLVDPRSTDHQVQHQRPSPDLEAVVNERSTFESLSSLDEASVPKLQDSNPIFNPRSSSSSSSSSPSSFSIDDRFPNLQRSSNTLSRSQSKLQTASDRDGMIKHQMARELNLYLNQLRESSSRLSEEDVSYWSESEPEFGSSSEEEDDDEDEDCSSSSLVGSESTRIGGIGDDDLSEDDSHHPQESI